MADGGVKQTPEYFTSILNPAIVTDPSVVNRTVNDYPGDDIIGPRGFVPA